MPDLFWNRAENRESFFVKRLGFQMKTTLAATQSNPKPTAVLMPGIGIDYTKAAEILAKHFAFQFNCAKAGIGNLAEANPGLTGNADGVFQDNLYKWCIQHLFR